MALRAMAGACLEEAPVRDLVSTATKESVFTMFWQCRCGRRWTTMVPSAAPRKEKKKVTICEECAGKRYRKPA